MVAARSRRRPGRRPGPTETREAILSAAREQFAERGYDRATIRAIARQADVNPALVHHFFGTKEKVFIEAMRFPFDPDEILPAVLNVPDEQLAEALVHAFLRVWADPERRAPVVALLRAAMTNERAAAMMREFVSTALLGRAAGLRDVPLLRIEAAFGQMIGIMLMRYVLKVEPIASASEEQLVELLARSLQGYLAR